MLILNEQTVLVTLLNFCGLMEHQQHPIRFIDGSQVILKTLLLTALVSKGLAMNHLIIEREASLAIQHRL